MEFYDYWLEMSARLAFLGFGFLWGVYMESRRHSK